MQSILASLDHCNQAFLFWTIQLTEQTSQTNQLTYRRREFKAVSPKILQTATAIFCKFPGFVDCCMNAQALLPYLPGECLVG